MLSSLFYFIFLKNYVCIYVILHEFRCTVCVQEPTGARRGHQITWNWSMSVLGTEPGTSARTVSALHHRTISSVPQFSSFK